MKAGFSGVFAIANYLQLTTIVPLVMFTADQSKMGALLAPRWVTWLAVATAFFVIALNIKLLADFALR
jgi:Mn2+/Fe2+ NRAMP family transporter